MVLLKRYLYFHNVTKFLWPIHERSEFPLGILLTNGFLDWIIFSTSILLRVSPVVVLLPVGQVSQFWATAWIRRSFSSALTPAGVFGGFLPF